jgi:hypothetical protein
MLGAEGSWLIGGILLGLVIPFTLIVILPTNRKLRPPDLARKSLDTRRLLDRWARLHAVRSVELQFVPGFPVRRNDRRSLERIFQIVIVISV